MIRLAPALVLPLLLGSLAACQSADKTGIETGISGSSQPPPAATDAGGVRGVVGAVLWDTVAQTPQDAERTAEAVCTRGGRKAAIAHERQKPGSATARMRFTCE